MYEAFYGFKEKPFSMLPDPGFLYLSKKHQAALTLLEYGLLNHVGFCVISGEAGAGKTTILRALLERVADDVTVGLITNTHQSFGGLLDWVLSAFDLHQPNLTHVEMHQIFMEYLIEEYANGHTVLLIVDEAQNMKADALEELRMLSNVNSEKDQLMQVVLAGQPALKETLRKPDLMQFAQRIAVDYHLDALNVVETCGYIQHRLKTAGAEKDVFAPAACERIHTYSGGTPRLINLLCETVLVYGFADQQDQIDVGLVDEMVQERMKDSVVPIVNRDAAEHDNKEATKALLKDFPWIEVKDKKPKPAKAKKEVETEPEAEKPVSAASSTDRGKQKSTVKTEAKPESKSESVKAAVSQKPVPPTVVPEEKGTKQQLIKFGSIAFVIAILLIGVALFLNGKEDSSGVIAVDETGNTVEEQVSNRAMLELQKKREQEEVRLKQLKQEAEALQKEREAAEVKIEEEKQAKKKAATAAALAARQAENKRLTAEKKRVAKAKERDRKAKQRDAKAKTDADRLKRERAELEEDRQVMKARLEEENRIKQAENTRRLEQEWQERQRQQQLAQEQAIAKARAERQAELEARAKAEAESKTSECSGPTARFKASCR
ncbi:hypothetical protein MNBD_GAMMA05-406 [hydrothermal vent metagenome]|uniref:AAA+ ATPase domain-containing protein n=1 Tax=hydrothermal vent metagenome TaxID=652676 RepID=A0A3B0WLT6_9ZZZZ